MSKKNPKKLLKEFVKNAVLKEGLVDTGSLDFDKHREILDGNLYDDGIDWDLLWNVVFNQLLRFHDWENQNKPLSDEDKEQFANSTHKFLAGVPFNYSFYFKLPDNYLLKPEKFNENISIIKADQEFVNSQEKINPISGFDKMIRGNQQESNHQLLTVGQTYLLVNDKGLVITGKKAFLESSYSPDRIYGIFLATHLITGCLKTDKLARDNPTPRVYDASGKYRANFVSPIRS